MQIVQGIECAAQASLLQLYHMKCQMRVHHVTPKHLQQQITDAHLSRTVAVPTSGHPACFKAPRLLAQYMSAAAVMSQTSNSFSM